MDPKSFAGDQGNILEVVSEIGRGGFGVVYCVKNQDGVQYALKLLHPTTDGAQELSFKQEIESVRGLASDHLLTVIDCGSVELKNGKTGLFAVYPLCKDGDYRTFLKNRSEIDVSQTIDQMLQVLSGLEILHTKIIHRDLKPENILMDGGRLMLADYGLAKFVDEATRTLSFKGAGTPAYMAPEVWQFKTISRATDLYAFGVLLFESLTGCLPFATSDVHELEQMHLYTPAPRVKSINPGVSDLIDGLIKKLLTKEPANRYQDAGEVIAVLSKQAVDISRDIGEITTKIRASHDKQEQEVSAAKKIQEEAQMEVNRNKYKEIELLDFVDDIISEINANLVEAKIVRNNYGPDCEYILGRRILRIRFFAQGEMYHNPKYVSQMDQLKKFHVVHGGYIEISEGRGHEREGWNLVLLRSPEDDMYGEWQIVESQLSALSGKATRFSPVATESQLFADNLAYHLGHVMYSWQLKVKKLEREDILKILKVFIP